MLEVIKQYGGFLVAGIVSVGSSIWSFISGKSKKNKNKALTQKEQEIDLDNFMVDECSRVESFSSFLKSSMNKAQLSEWKKTEVLKNVTMYALANSYSWYNKGVYEDKLAKYIENANIASGKKTPNQLGNKN